MSSFGMKFLGRPLPTRRLALRSTILFFRPAGLRFRQHHDDAGGGGVVEEVVRVSRITPSIRSRSTNHLRMLRSLSSCLAPEPRVIAPVSSTTAARPRSFRQASVCWSHAQSPLPVVMPPRVRKRSNGSLAIEVGIERLIPHGISDHDVVGVDLA